MADCRVALADFGRAMEDLTEGAEARALAAAAPTEAADATVQIRALSSTGAGVGNLADGRVIFVPRTAPGDEIRLRITHGKPRCARAKNGRALIPFALDHGVWSEPGSGVISHMKQTYEADGFRGNYDLWVTGTVTPRARRELAAMGIKVTENVDERIGFLD